MDTRCEDNFAGVVAVNFRLQVTNGLQIRIRCKRCELFECVNAGPKPEQTILEFKPGFVRKSTISDVRYCVVFRNLYQLLHNDYLYIYD